MSRRLHHEVNILTNFHSRDLQEKYETLLRELKLKDNKIKYLNGYFETITAKMQAVHRAIAEKEKKIKDATDRSKLSVPSGSLV